MEQLKEKKKLKWWKEVEGKESECSIIHHVK